MISKYLEMVLYYNDNFVFKTLKTFLMSEVIGDNVYRLS